MQSLKLWLNMHVPSWVDTNWTQQGEKQNLQCANYADHHI